MMYCKIYSKCSKISLLVFTLYTHILLKIAISVLICKYNNALNAKEEILASNSDTDSSYPDGDPDAT